MSKVTWMALYAGICCLEFLLAWAREHVEDQIIGKPRRRPPTPDPREPM